MKKARSKRDPAQTITDAENADNIALLANTPTTAKPLSIVWSRQQVTLVSMWMQTKRSTRVLIKDISTLNGGSLKLQDKFNYLGSRVSATKNDINMQLAKHGQLSIAHPSYGSQLCPQFFQTVVMSLLLYGCTTWTLTKCIEKI